MPRISDIRRIIVEDFKQEDQDLASKIAGSYNDFGDEVIQVLNGAIDYENLARSQVVLELSLNPDGSLRGSPKVNSNLASVSGLVILKVDNLTNRSARLTQSPYIQFTNQGNGIISIDYAIGFLSGSKYRVVLELIQ